MPDNDSIIPPQDSSEATERRKFPAIPQLMVLSGLLLVLLGSATVSLVIPDKGNPQNTWVETDLTASNQPTASLTTNTIRPLAEIDIEAKAGFVYDVMNQRVLFQKAADEPLPIASITKLMTALVAHELLADDTTVVVPQTATVLDSASGLTAGERLSTKALLDYSMLASSNDSAHSLATAGAALISDQASEAVFVEAMNVRAKELGLNTVTFNNSHGLDVSTTEAGAYGSARDITFLMEYILQEYPELLAVTTDDRARIYNNAGEFYNAVNTNRARTDIPQLLGSKTGYTILAGGNLTIVFDAGFNRPIIVTVLGSSFSGRFADVLDLIEATRTSLSTTSE